MQQGLSDANQERLPDLQGRLCRVALRICCKEHCITDKRVASKNCRTAMTPCSSYGSCGSCGMDICAPHCGGSAAFVCINPEVDGGACMSDADCPPGFPVCIQTVGSADCSGGGVCAALGSPSGAFLDAGAIF